MASYYKFLGYRCYIQKSGSYDDYRKFYIEPISGYVADAAKRYDSEPNEYNLERLKLIRELGQSAKYLDGAFDGSFEIHWQADRENWRNNQGWYAPRIETRFHADSIAFMGKLSKLLGHEPSPSLVIETLNKLGLKPVFHRGECPYGAWIFGDMEVDPADCPFEDMVIEETEAEKVEMA
jgi:hypothetical protein